MSSKEERIRELAHAIWLNEGKPHGRAEQHWELARRQVEAQEAQVSDASTESAEPMPPIQPDGRETEKPADRRRKAVSSSNSSRPAAGNGKAGKSKPRESRA
ncbi:MAG TPA: DUF2934 domain-containing protein [Dongiaceae bacterium]|nr:DUF2934 domain-containing protein [Dongiaceae bacterium]